ncbi:hypothetical protein [Methylobacter sp. sgz302048]|uniref:hypothetical protein n=1 Tax=Methylobacter sp. sgz302048 TaxID=3455945 RepID=UPI003FA0F912
MDAAILGIVGLGGVPVVQYALPLSVRQYADLVHGSVRGGEQVFQRCVHQGAQPFRRHPVDRVCTVSENPVAQIING